MGDHKRNGSGGGQRCPPSSRKFELRIGRLHDRLARLIHQMRRCMSALCGTTQKEGDEVMRQIFRTRQKMQATRRRIINLKFQDKARN